MPLSDVRTITYCLLQGHMRLQSEVNDILPEAP